MGLFWDLYQQSQISSQRQRSATLEQRMTQVENELHQTQQLMRDLIERLEKHVGADLDEDGRIG